VLKTIEKLLIKVFIEKNRWAFPLLILPIDKNLNMDLGEILNNLAVSLVFLFWLTKCIFLSYGFFELSSESFYRVISNGIQGSALLTKKRGGERKL
jgi:hypothetical protein